MRCSCICPAIGKGFELSASLADLIQDVQEITGRTCQSIKPSHQQNVAGSKSSNRLRQGLPIRYSAAMANLKGMNVEALMKLRNQVDEKFLAVAIGVGGAIALAIIGYLLHWISS
jgi:hypothetical protein